MVRTHWIKSAAIIGTAVTLSLVTYPASDASATAVSKDAQTAGISASLDKDKTAEQEEVRTLAASTKKSAKKASDKETKKSSKKAAKAEKTSKKAKKKNKVSKRWKTTGVSIANSYVNVRKRPSTEDSKIVGRLYKGSAAKIVKETKNGWVKVKSGSVKGYIKEEYLATGNSAKKLSKKYGKRYLTVKKGVVTLNVRKKTSTKSKILVQIPEDKKYKIEKDCGKEWLKVSLDDGHGYVAKEYVDEYVKLKKAVSMKEIRAKQRKKAEAEAERERVEQEEANAAGISEARSAGESIGSDTAISEKNSSSDSDLAESHSKGSSTGSQIVSYARKFLGNKYVYGGTSLTNGTDCSGFTMKVYAAFGYSIPRTSREQSVFGESVSLSNVKAGDLIFYKNGSSVGHVAIYMSDGNVIHASNHVDGIKISNMYYRTPYCARRIIR